MRELVYYVATTLDGRIAASDGSADAFTGDPGYLRELHLTYADALPAPAQEALGIRPQRIQWDAVLMGRRTYEVGLRAGLSDPYPHLEQYVFSRSLKPEECQGVTVVDGDPGGFVRSLKAEPGGRIWLCGGGELATTLAGQIDRLILKVNPVTIGEGIPLFGAGLPGEIPWRLVATRTFPAGVLLAEYERG